MPLSPDRLLVTSPDGLMILPVLKSGAPERQCPPVIFGNLDLYPGKYFPPDAFASIVFADRQEQEIF